MAKKIKFYLHCNGQKIANMEALRKNFNLEDIVEQFQSGKLQRWLESQGFVRELEKVRAISAKGIEQVAKELLKVFELELSADEEKDAIMDILYTQKRHAFLQKIANAQKEHVEVIRSYHKGFQELFNEILANPTDRILIKRNLQSIAKEHLNLVLLYRISFVSLLKVRAPLALLLSFGVQEFEQLWRFGMLEDMESTQGYAKEHFLDYEDAFLWGGLKHCVDLIHRMIDDAEVMQGLIIANLVKTYKENTQGLWREIESINTRYLIIRFSTQGSSCCQIAPMVEKGEKTVGLSPNEVIGKCLIFDGLQYQSTQEELVIYLEL